MRNFKSGTYISQGTFKSFSPNKINREWQLDDIEVIALLSKADRQLGRLDMYSDYIPNIELFIRMHVLKEATKSSKIEGTKTNIEDALQAKADISEEKRDDWEEVQNYIEALNSAIEALQELPFSTRLIKQTHSILLQNVRGKHKLPGEFRSSQNWIGGASISDAVFIPPYYKEVSELMSDLEKFAHNEQIHLPDLLKIALIHYQFETIHPFLDGNGRVGRLMITLYLVEKQILKKPILYLSDFLERNRALYYDNLMKVREQNNIQQWFKFFLVGIIETAKSSILTFDNILKLQKDVDEKLQRLGSRTNNARTILSHLYLHPLIDAQKVNELTGLSMPSSYTLISELEGLGIIQEITGAKRGKNYWFEDYIALFK
ncbi:Fic family protein [Robiginitalea myxolifaciens]|uniref:Fic family protein n=1 Tax=Robiginitalea myxolifaciens TaxID=400055 RepID=A0A1I6FSH5_9FLAO|nr:Fic family protein [Robiginitalea myxolifaciens]SFR32910.1 Fic family protein [Robiginitalea myxolifaciens]